MSKAMGHVLGSLPKNELFTYPPKIFQNTDVFHTTCTKSNIKTKKIWKDERRFYNKLK